MDRRDIFKMAAGMVPFVVVGNQFKRIEPKEIKSLLVGTTFYLVNPLAVDIQRLCEESILPGQVIEVRCRPGMSISDEFQAHTISWDKPDGQPE